MILVGPVHEAVATVGYRGDSGCRPPVSYRLVFIALDGAVGTCDKIDAILVDLEIRLDVQVRGYPGAA